MSLTFGSLFAGIGGFDAGFDRAGLRCVWQVENDAAANRVLNRHWPDVLKGDDVQAWNRKSGPKVDIICGGFPCTDLSIAGQRQGLKGERSGLFYEMVRVTDEFRPGYLVWENVPGLLSSDAGRDFGRVIRSLADIGYFGAWRCLDAQFFGVAQRRRRVFGVFARGRAGAGRAAEILALTQSSGGHPAKGRQKAEGVAATLRSRSHGAGVSAPGRGGEDDENLIVCPTLGGHHARNAPDDPLVSLARCDTTREGLRQDSESGTLVVSPCLRSNMHNNSDPGMNARMLVIANTVRASEGHHGHSSPRGDGSDNLVAFTLKSSHRGVDNGWCGNYVSGDKSVRRLTPVECLRLQGFPDGWLDMEPPLSDTVKYRLIGNAVVPSLAEWIGRRIVEAHEWRR